MSYDHVRDVHYDEYYVDISLLQASYLDLLSDKTVLQKRQQAEVYSGD
jgi:hypothetical protein